MPFNSSSSITYAEVEQQKLIPSTFKKENESGIYEDLSNKIVYDKKYTVNISTIGNYSVTITAHKNDGDFVSGNIVKFNVIKNQE